jgi:molybdopterin converting factor small subunit
MATIRIPTPLRSYASGQAEVTVRGESVGAVMEDLTSAYPALRQHLFTNQEELRPYVNLFLNGENVRDLAGLATPVDPDDRLMLIPSIAGGSG